MSFREDSMRHRMRYIWIFEPVDNAIGIITQSLGALAPILNHLVLSPVHSAGGHLGIANLALPVRLAHADTE